MTTEILNDEDALRAVRDPTSREPANADRVRRLNTAASALLDQIAGPVIRRTISGEVHRTFYDTERDSIRGIRGSHLWLDQWPIYQVTTLTEYDDRGAATVLEAETLTERPNEAYLTTRYSLTTTTPPHVTDDVPPVGEYALSGQIRRRQAGRPARWTPGHHAVEADYVAGRYPDTDAVPEFWRQAAVLLLKFMWRSEQPSIVELGDYEVPAVNYPTFAVPNAVRDHLGPEFRGQRS